MTMIKQQSPHSPPGVDTARADLRSTGTILIICQDREMTSLFRCVFERLGCTVLVATGLRAAEALFAQHTFDLIVTDDDLPKADLHIPYRQRHLNGNVPTLTVNGGSLPPNWLGVVSCDPGTSGTANDCPADQDLPGLRSHQESCHARDGETAILFAGWQFFPRQRTLVSPSNRELKLTHAEADLLLVFCRYARQTLSRQELVKHTRGDRFATGGRSIDILVSRLRRKLTDDNPLTHPIQTVRNDGYIWCHPVTISKA